MFLLSACCRNLPSFRRTVLPQCRRVRVTFNATIKTVARLLQDIRKYLPNFTESHSRRISFIVTAEKISDMKSLRIRRAIPPLLAITPCKKAQDNRRYQNTTVPNEKTRQCMFIRKIGARLSGVFDTVRFLNKHILRRVVVADRFYLNSRTIFDKKDQY
jgi:hypothetical protein